MASLPSILRQWRAEVFVIFFVNHWEWHEWQQIPLRKVSRIPSLVKGMVAYAHPTSETPAHKSTNLNFLVNDEFSSINTNHITGHPVRLGMT